MYFSIKIPSIFPDLLWGLLDELLIFLQLGYTVELHTDSEESSSSAFGSLLLLAS